MSAVFHYIGLGHHMKLWLDVTYSSPTAPVKFNNGVFAEFPLRNGTQQGCPHSPLILPLNMESLLPRIRSNPNILELPSPGSKHKLTG